MKFWLLLLDQSPEVSIFLLTVSSLLTCWYLSKYALKYLSVNIYHLSGIRYEIVQEMEKLVISL